MGLPVISPVRCLNLGDQLAQKLHACTGPHAQGRARDVLDILLIDLWSKWITPRREKWLAALRRARNARLSPRSHHTGGYGGLSSKPLGPSNWVFLLPIQP